MGFEEHEWPSGVVTRSRLTANYRETLGAWFGQTGAATRTLPPARAVGGASDGTAAMRVPHWLEEPASGRIPFLIF